MELWIWLHKLIVPLTRDRNGALAVVLAISLVPLMLGTGLSIDIGRAYIVKQNLMRAADAAALAVASASGNGQSSQDVAEKFLSANYPSSKLGTPGAPTVTITDAQVTVAATATLETTFMKLAGLETITVSATSIVSRETTGLELVLVLDNTGSMANDGKLEALKDAAEALIETLFEDDATSDTVKIGLVPFAGGVNVGNGNSAFTAAYVDDPTAYDWGTTEWEGCVMARTAPYDQTDDSVAVGGSWAPFYWADDWYNNWYSSWWGYSIDDSPPSSQGPNKYCPRAITPLTNVKATLLSEIDAMWATGYTHVNLGAAWGWRVISPDPPFEEGAAYDSTEWNKAVIILTDGQNTTSNSVYTAYEYRSDGVLGSTSSSGTTDELNDRLSTICANIKAEGIEVFTITFQLDDTDTQTIFENCASEADNYFDSPSNSDLETAFQVIGAKLKRLHLSQ